MSLNKALENLKFDKRLVDINVRQGRLTQEEYDQHLKTLKDLEADVEKLNLEDSDTESSSN